jgi:Leucine-rich repeat (LRR) protein
MPLWRNYRYCTVDYTDFPLADRNKSFTFTGNSASKQEITAVFFSKSPTFEFIPLEIFSEFPNLNGIMIQRSIIPIIKSGFFTTEFKVIQYIYLGSNEIKTIEKDAFLNMVDLKWINLESNHIAKIESAIFKNNNKLEFISLANNEIKMIHPQLFSNLNNLIEVLLFGNDCVNKHFEGSSSLTLSTMNNSLQNCYNNCKLIDDVCVEKELEKPSGFLQILKMKITDFFKK